MLTIPVPVVLALLAAAPVGAAGTSVSPATAADARPAHRALAEISPFRGLPWRNVGLEPVPGERLSFHVAPASGGLSKTANDSSRSWYGGASAELSFEVEEPEPSTPRTEPAPRIRGQWDDVA